MAMSLEFGAGCPEQVRWMYVSRIRTAGASLRRAAGKPLRLLESKR